MNTNAVVEREIDLKDLLYRTLKKWRKIIAGAIIIAILAALYQAASGVILMLDDEKLAEAQNKYEIAVNDYEATGERLRTNIVNLREQSANQQEYNEKSELMRVDPMNKWIGNLQLYIDSKYQIDPSLTFQNVDLTTRLVAAYTSYLRSGELYNDMLKEIQTVEEIRFLTEIYSVGADPGTATITVNAVGKSETDVREILDYVTTRIAEHYNAISHAIGDHSYDILTESVYSTIDLDLDAKQKANLLAISDYANAIGEQNELLTEWERTTRPRQEFGAWYTTKQAIKSFVIGGVVGVILMFGWFAVCYAVSDTMKTEEDWKCFGIPVIGFIKKDRKEQHLHRIDDLIDCIFSRRHKTTETQDCALAAHNLSTALHQQGIGRAVFVGHIERVAAERMMQKMSTEVASIEFSFAGDPLTESAAAANIGGSEKIILLAENNVTHFRHVNQIHTILQALGKTSIGVIVID